MTTPPSPPNPKAIIFDLLTGLLDSWTLWDASTPTGTSLEGRKWRKQYLEVTFGSTVYGPGSTYEELVARSAGESGLPNSAPEALLQNWKDLTAWPEVGRVLRALREKGYLLGVVTNCSKKLGHAAVRNAEKAAEGAGEGTWKFDAAVTAEETGWYKPAVQAYHGILPLLGEGVRPEDVLFVAGSAGDVVGATKAGFRVVWNNHVGLERKGDVLPLREGKSLDEALRDFL
ncbi:HAD-like protein [Karstenula rhodostoma CBS 690.94]|uniref:HAD-like protein n=1 Tax=Karstenula rhodostoma CBS 690.94 TaxID=1392251 RepID=A0A9P4P821_9PLEO|nr:HAD-like protein [Karstenula rhodostoma CBS 690.94]